MKVVFCAAALVCFIATTVEGEQPQVEITTSKPEPLNVTAQEPLTVTHTMIVTDEPPQEPTNAPPQEATKPTTQKPATQRPIPTTVKKPATLKTITKVKPKRNGRKSCRGKGAFAASMKYWCNINCNHRPPHCPRSHCVCRYTQ